MAENDKREGRAGIEADHRVPVSPPFVGLDGFATLALSCLVILTSFGITLVVALGHVVRTGLVAPADVKDCTRILILGYRLRQGQYSDAVYRERLDRALVLLRHTPSAKAFLLGGRRRAGLPSEASVGAAYLRTRGIGPWRIRLEDRSRHTLENLRHYKAAFPPDSDGNVALISSRFHLARVALMAHGLGLAVIPYAAETARLAALRRPDWLVTEALMVHWYFVGRCFSHWTGNRRMLARIS